MGRSVKKSNCTSAGERFGGISFLRILNTMHIVSGSIAL